MADRARCQSCGFLHDDARCPNCGAPPGIIGRLWREPIMEQLRENRLQAGLAVGFLVGLPALLFGYEGSLVFIGWTASLILAFGVGVLLKAIRETQGDEKPQRTSRPGTLRAREDELRAELADVAARRARLQPLGAALASAGSDQARDAFARAQRLVDQRQSAIAYEQALIDVVRWRNGAEQALVPAFVSGGAQGVLQLAEYGTRLAERLCAFERDQARELAASVGQSIAPLRALAARYAEADLAAAVDGLTHRADTLTPEGASPDDPLAARLHAHLDALPRRAPDIVQQDARLQLELDDAEELLHHAQPNRTRA